MTRFSLVLLLSSLAVAQSWTCPSGWSLYAPTRKCIRAYSTKRTWTSAVSACKAVGGNLVTITNPAENDYVYSKRLAESWIGLSDRHTEKKWVWQDGSSSTYRSWLKGEPNNANNEDCAVIGGWGGKKQWGDVACTNTRAYVCGRVAIAATKAPTKRSSCLPGWSYYSPTQKCIRGYSDKRTWVAAQAACRAVGANLVTISSLDENSFVYGKRLAESWIGFNDRSVEGQWVWVDGASSTYSNWRPGEPDNHLGGQDCAMIGGYGGSTQWGDLECSATRAFICAMTTTSTQQPISLPTVMPTSSPSTPPTRPPSVLPTAIPTTLPTTSPTSLPASTCPSGWSYYSPTQKCIRGYSDKRTWSSAQAACRAVGANLVTISSLAENSFVYGKRLTESWIGLNDRSVENRWRWIDGSSSTYRHWRKGQPDNHLNKEDCAVIGGWGHSRRWGDIICTAKRGYICATTIRPTTTPPSEETVEGEETTPYFE